MSEDKKITTVVHWSNGMVSVFDQHGQQIPEFQGQYWQVQRKILEATKDRDDVSFQAGAWRTIPSTISREKWTGEENEKAL